MKIKVLTSDAANKNIQDTNSMIQTFDGALQEIHDNLSRVKELTVSAGSGALTDEDRTNIQREIDSIKAGITDIANNTEFNGAKLSVSNVPATLPGDVNPTKVIKGTIGTMDDENMEIPFFDVTATNLGISDLTTTDVGSGITAVDKAIQMVSAIRSKYGSIQNRLEGTADYLGSKSLSIEKAQSNIGDADIAEEMMNYSKNKVLIEASASLMAQSNNFPKDALNILANVK